MRLLGVLVLGSLGIALLQAATKLALLLILLTATGAFIARPKELIGLLLLLGLFDFANRYPAPALMVLGALTLLGALSKR
jgi:hypothetical protein